MNNYCSKPASRSGQNVLSALAISSSTRHLIEKVENTPNTLLQPCETRREAVSQTHVTGVLLVVVSLNIKHS